MIDYAKIKRVFAGELETTVLTAREQEIWEERFIDLMSRPGPYEEEFFAELRRKGGLVGLKPIEEQEESKSSTNADTQWRR